jgi:hypothetical protein
VEPGPLRFEIEKAKMNWGAYLRDLMRPRFGGGFERYSGGGPSVVAVNGIGERRVIAVCRNVHEAKDKAAVVESELTSLGAVAWSERYGVPQAFLSG